MDEATTPGPKIQAYVEANLQLVARGDHALARALASAGSSEALATLQPAHARQPGSPAARRAHRPRLVGPGPDGRTGPVDRLRPQPDDRGRAPLRAATRLARELLSPYLDCGSA